MTATCNWPHCPQDAKPGYNYCPEHMTQWQEVAKTATASGLQTLLVFLWGEIEELERKIDAARCDCPDCIRRRSWD